MSTTIPAETVAATPPIAALPPSPGVNFNHWVSRKIVLFCALQCLKVDYTRRIHSNRVIQNPIAGCILAPVVVFVSFWVVDVFLLKPYNSFLYVLQVLYSVFCGVAFIMTVILGFSFRVFIVILCNIVLEGEAVEEEGESITERPVVVKPERRRSVNKRRRFHDSPEIIVYNRFGLVY